jgi:hypothetical protein
MGPCGAVKLHRSIADSKIFDQIDAAYDRYIRGERSGQIIEVWKLTRQVKTASAGTVIRIQANSRFLLHWTKDEWQHATDTNSTATALGVQFVYIPLSRQESAIRFTFFWPEQYRRENKDYVVEVHP